MISEPEIATSSLEWTPRLSFYITLALVLFALLTSRCFASGSVSPAEAMNNCQGSEWLQKGNEAFEAHDNEVAENQWLRIRACPSSNANWPKAVFNLGLLEYQRNNNPKAIGYFEEVLQIHPNDKEPGASIMETNRNYSYRSALAISECYERMGQFSSALHYAWLGKTTYPYYSWCGTCHQSADWALKKRIAYLAVRLSRVHLWGGLLIAGFVAMKVRRRV